MKLLMLGGLKLESTTLTRPKPLLLLAYLSLEGSRSRRDVASLFWGTIKDPMQGLRQALVQLNKDAGGAVQSREGKLWTEVQSDVSELQKALAQGDLDKAIERYQGPLLEGFDVADIGEELEEWIYRIREELASQIREVHIKLGEQEAYQGNYNKAAKCGEAAYLLRSAPEPSLETLERVYLLLQGDNSVHANNVAKETSTYGLNLTKTVQEARLELNAKKLSPKNNQAREAVIPSTAIPSATIPSATTPLGQQRETGAVAILEAPPPRTSEQIVTPIENVAPKPEEKPSLILPEETPLYSPKTPRSKRGFLWATVPLGLVTGISVMLWLSNHRTVQVFSGSVPATDAYVVHSNDGLDDVDVGLHSGYFCAVGNNLFLSSSYDNQSTAIRFPDIGLPRSTPEVATIIKQASLIFTASNDLTPVPAESGFIIKGIPDGSAWVKNENCDIPAAQNYINRPRTNLSVTYQPTVWRIGQPYEIDVTLILQEIVDNPDWAGNALAFAVDKLPDSMADLKVYSNEGAEVAKNPTRPSHLRLEYTLNSAKN
jgi:hypothetical protein